MANNFNNYTLRRALSAQSPPLTIAGWFNCPSTATSNRAIVTWQAVGVVTPSVRWALTCDGGPGNNKKVTLSEGDGTTTWNTATSTQFNFDTWHHACAVISSSTSRTVYLDAGGATTLTHTNNTTTCNTVTVAGLIIANGTNAIAAEKQIADVAIWTAALSLGEITALSKGISASQIRPDQLLVYFPLIRDFQELLLGGSYTATGDGSATVTNHPRIYT
jgi:hypothetical protein